MGTSPGDGQLDYLIGSLGAAKAEKNFGKRGCRASPPPLNSVYTPLYSAAPCREAE
jgi:hypothetical protein